MDTSGEASSSSGTASHITETLRELKIDQSVLFEHLLKRYYFQLTKGCGNTQCENLSCASNQNVHTPGPLAAALTAIQLANEAFSQTGMRWHFCTPGEEDDVLALLVEQNMSPKPKSFGVSLHYPILVHLAEIAKRQDNYTPLIDRLKNGFSSPDALNVSFLKPGAESDIVSFDPESSGIDFGSVTESYKLIESLKNPKVIDAMATSIAQCIPKLKEEGPSMRDSRRLRAFLIVLESPIMIEPVHHLTIVAPLSTALLTLKQPMQTALELWWSNFPRVRFLRLITIFQQFMTVQLYSLQYIDEKIAQAVQALRLLYNANERARIVDYSEFYNDAVNNIVDLKQDYGRWVRTRTTSGTGFSSFSFCAYPYILDPASKTKILQVDASEQQQAELQNAFVRYHFLAQPTLPFLVLRVRRDNLLYTTLNELAHKQQDLKKPLKVHFVGEEGVDEGGVRKEFFQLVVRNLFDLSYGMFTYNEGSRAFWFNPNSLENDSEFALVGMVFGLAIYNAALLDVHLPLVAYRKLLGLRPTLDDLRDVDPGLHAGLVQLLSFEGDVESVYCRTFQIERDVFGSLQTVDLKEGGGSIPVTNENKKEYVDLYVKYLLQDSIDHQFRAFQQGFEKVCGGPCLKLFRAEELELLVCGSSQLDFEALERVTRYDDGYTKDSRVIKDFWAVVHSLAPEQKKKLLAFSTGSDRVPIRGLGNMLFVISRNGGDTDRLPTAHTCFNHLLLPEYKNREKLRERVLLAIENAQGFGLK